MTTTLKPSGRATAAPGRLLPDPFLHLGPDRIYSPLLDRTLLTGQPGHAELRALLMGEELSAASEIAIRRLAEEGWLVDSPERRSHDYHLKYVSLETHTVCNQRCYFCPVSTEPRSSYFMPDELFGSIVLQLRAWRDTLEGVFLMLYNEPTLDRRFLEHCLAVMDAGLPAAVNTNATGLTPARVDVLVDRGPLRFLSVNLSTLDRERYARDRGADQLDLVLRNLDYARNKRVAEEMVVMVLGEADEAHRHEIARIGERFRGSLFEVRSGEIMDRAGHLDVGLKAESRAGALCGCENLGSRPLQHLHVTPQGRVVLCCEDYSEQFVVGDLTQESILEVLTGERLAAFRRQAYGLEPSAPSFLCHNCIFALRG